MSDQDERDWVEERLHSLGIHEAVSSLVAIAIVADRNDRVVTKVVELAMLLGAGAAEAHVRNEYEGSPFLRYRL